MKQLKNKAQVELELNIDSDKQIVKIIGRTTIDGKEVLKYEKDVDDCIANGVFLDDIIQMLSKPIDTDIRFKGALGIE